VTFEHTERRVSFLSALLPSTPETLNHVLERAGLRVSPPAHLGLPPVQFSSASSRRRQEQGADAVFAALLGEAGAALASEDFGTVVAAALDVGTDTLLEGLLKSAFGEGPWEEEDEPRVRLAGLLPGLARWSRLALTGLPNELVDVSLWTLCVQKRERC
jgi:peroxin-3